VLLRTRDPHAALAELRARDRQHVFLEGGPTLAAAFLRAGLVDEIVAYVAPLLLGAGIPAGKVRSLDDVYSWEQTRSQGLVLEVDHPAYGALTLPGSPIRFEDNPFSGGRAEHLPPPLLDEHGAAVREWLDS
jgi:crotonobetainyl-CoA:carnitine CoA-transferase CaiB-like acyl-CoA transferase